jgi:hypothetical protein
MIKDKITEDISMSLKLPYIEHSEVEHLVASVENISFDQEAMASGEYDVSKE